MQSGWLRVSERNRSLPKTPPPSPPEDKDSLGEALGFATGADLSSVDLAHQIRALTRSDGYQGHVHRVRVCGVYVVGIAAGAMLIALVIHYILPAHFLSAEQASDLQKFLFSGGIGYASKGALKKKRAKTEN